MELYKYQEEAVNKAVNYFENTSVAYPKFNIFFEMGLGKTVQAIASMVSLYNSGSSHFLLYVH